MQYETKSRSIAKAFSWRTLATLTTTGIVFAFTGRLAMAMSVGFIEVFAKMGLYFFHERAWQKIGYGKKEIPAFVVWFTGLPASGKTTLADEVFRDLKQRKLKVERLDSKDVRPLFPEISFSEKDVNRHIKRVGHLAAMLEKNGVIVIASFVSPYAKSRSFVKKTCRQYIEVYLKATPEACAMRDPRGNYAKAKKGELQNFPGINASYDEPSEPHITIELDKLEPEEAKNKVVNYLNKRFLNGSRQ